MTADSEGEVSIRRRKLSGAIGLRLIVGYKLVKAVVEPILGVVLLSFASAGLAGHLRAVALNIRHHAAEAWSVALAERLVRASTERNLLVVGLATLLDGALSFVEGWALHHRYRWSHWLVVGTTSSFLPFEGLALAHHFSAGRIALLIGNALIVIYLVRHGIAVARHSSRDETAASMASKGL
jgi:uncharacterized membrane protein (DUF2068 family)